LEESLLSFLNGKTAIDFSRSFCLDEKGLKPMKNYVPMIYRPED